MISILIIDDHPIVLKGTKTLFDDIPNMNVEIENHPKNVLSTIVNKQYDVYVIDINMTEKNGLQLASEIKMYQTNSKVILYTGEDIHPYYPLILEKRLMVLFPKQHRMRELFKRYVQSFETNIYYRPTLSST